MQDNYRRLPLLIDESGGKREVILAEPRSQASEYVVQSIPAFTYGLGIKDVIRVIDGDLGTYEVISRGKQVVIRIYVDGVLDQPAIRSVINNVLSLGGCWEVGKNSAHPKGKSLLLIALASEVGFAKIEALMKQCDLAGFQWEYGNVYDVHGNPLNWW